MKSFIRLVTISGVWAASVTPLHGSQRDGLHLAVGAGAGWGAWDIAVAGRDESSGTSSFTTSFEIGGAATRAVNVFYFQRTAWFSSDVTIVPGEFGGPLSPQRVARTLTQGITGLGVTVHLTGDTPSLFLSGGVGMAWWSQVFEESTECFKLPLVIPCTEVSGLGAMLGTGLELGRRFALELVAIWGTPSGGDGTRFAVESSSVVVSLGGQFRLF